MQNPDPITIIILLFVGLLLIVAVVQGGKVATSPAPRRKARKTNGQKINVNVNGRKVRTITIKEHTRKVYA